MVAVNNTEPETGLQSNWYYQQCIPYAPDPPEPDETPVSCRSHEVKAQFHLVQRQAELLAYLGFAAPYLAAGLGAVSGQTGAFGVLAGIASWSPR
jgi:hypothetical protein